MLIGELSEKTGASTRSLRYYEHKGLIGGRRLPNGYRDFAADQVDRVRDVRCLLGFGFSTERASEILALWAEMKPFEEGGDGRLEGVLALARARLEEMDEHLRALADARARLEDRVRFLEGNLEGNRAEASRAESRSPSLPTEKGVLAAAAP